jgi:hypothetical protein
MFRNAALFLALLASSVLALGQVQPQSVRSSLTNLKTLNSWKVGTPIVPIPGLKLERSQLYLLSLKLQNANTDLGLLMGAKANNAFVHYVSIVYDGAAVRDAGYAHGYLTKLVALTCMGLNEADYAPISALMSRVISKMKTTRVSESVRVGAVRAEASAAFKNNTLSVTMLLERGDAPGKAWASYCDFER